MSLGGSGVSIGGVRILRASIFSVIPGKKVFRFQISYVDQKRLVIGWDLFVESFIATPEN